MRNIPVARSSPIITVKAFPAPAQAMRPRPTVMAVETTGTAMPLAKQAQVLKAVMPVASKVTSKLEDTDENTGGSEESDTPLTPQSMDDLIREVQDLEQQEKRAMASRASSLEHAMTVTSDCADGDPGCGQAHLDVKWKTAKDKYEQVMLFRLCTLLDGVKPFFMGIQW